MAKKKKNTHHKKQTSGQPTQNTRKQTEKVNPFELKVNRQKHNIVGQKTKTKFGSKNSNKIKVNEKRRDFFKKIHLHRNKANNFIDKRIGEYDSDMLKEERVLARIAEDQRKHYKKRLYNLNDEFDLTHDGQPISSLETFDDVEDTDEEDDSQLDADFVSEAHFGGFLIKKDSNAPKTHREIVSDFIAESKKKKQEKKEEKEKTDDLTSQLDAEWKQIHSMLPDGNKQDVNKGPSDPFDLTIRELKFEPRATPVVKARDEMVENQKRMKKLEEEKKSRMHRDVLKKPSLSTSVEAIEEDFEVFSEENVNAETDNNLDETELNSSADSSSELSDSMNEDLNQERTLVEESCAVPQSLKALLNLLSDLNPDEISSKLNPLVSKCRFKANGKNIDISKKFFRLLLEYLDFQFKDNLDVIEIFEIISQCLFTLAQRSALESGEVLRTFLFEKIALYNETKQKKNFEHISILILLKLCGRMYSTSDFRHPIATPAMTLMSDVLNSPAQVTIPNIACRIFICNVMYEYVSYSKRFVPEVVNYLFSILVLASDCESSFFNSINKSNLKIMVAKKILHVTSKIENWEPTGQPLQWLKCTHSQTSENVTKLTIIHEVISLLYKFAELYRHLPIFFELFRPASDLLLYLPSEFYPESIITVIHELGSLVTKEKSIQRLSFSNKKHKLPKLFIPRFEDFSGKKPSGILEKTKVHKQLSKKIKKEQKGIIREVRRDSEFLAREQLYDRIEADNQRKRKVKELYAQLATQEGEYKRFAKKK